jgi:hypothetical protein
VGIGIRKFPSLNLVEIGVKSILLAFYFPLKKKVFEKILGADLKIEIRLSCIKKLPLKKRTIGVRSTRAVAQKPNSK